MKIFQPQRQPQQDNVGTHEKWNARQLQKYYKIGEYVEF